MANLVQHASQTQGC